VGIEVVRGVIDERRGIGREQRGMKRSLRSPLCA
jgi:hypothetical protein